MVYLLVALAWYIIGVLSCFVFTYLEMEKGNGFKVYLLKDCLTLGILGLLAIPILLITALYSWMWDNRNKVLFRK